MNHVKDALSKGMRAEIKPDHNESIMNERAISLVNTLFTVLNTHISFFKLNYSNNQDEYMANKREWVKTFQERRISLEEVQAGVSKIRKLKEPLKNITPADFLRMCSPCAEDFGLPHVNDAYNEAIKNYGANIENPKWSHPTIRHAAYYTKSFELMNQPRDKSFKLFEHNYQKAIKLFISGGIGEFMTALPGADDIALMKENDIVMERYRGLKPEDALKAMRQLL